MKVKDLINKLQLEDPESIVVVDGYETGMDEVHKMYRVNISQNSYKNNWDGEFEVDSQATSATSIPAIYLPRSSAL